MISTGDKDLAQLVDAARHAGQHDEQRNARRGRACSPKFGVPPERIVDYLTLVGDAVDNVPGVAKVGPKTAVKWLTQYGSLDGVIAAAGRHRRRGRRKPAHCARFPAARTPLVTVRCDLPNLPHDAGRTRAACPRSHAHDRAVHALRNEVVAEGSARRADGRNARSRPRRRSHTLPDLLEQRRRASRRLRNHPRLADLRALAGEDRGGAAHRARHRNDQPRPFAARLVGISFAVAPGEAAICRSVTTTPARPFSCLCEEALAPRPWLESPHHAKIGQNLNTTSTSSPTTASRWPASRTTRCCNPTCSKPASPRRARARPRPARAAPPRAADDQPTRTLCGKGASQIGFNQVEVEQAAEYGAEDADLCLRLHERLFPQIQADGTRAHLRRDRDAGRARCFSAWSATAC